MTLRSRKKPPTTVLIHTATEPSSLANERLNSGPQQSTLDVAFAGSDSVVRARSSFSAAAIIGVASVFLCCSFVCHADAADPASSWSPTRPKKSLASTKVSAKPVSDAKSGESTNTGWTVASRAKNTSTRLQWGTASIKADSKKAKTTPTEKPKAVRATAMPRRVVTAPKPATRSSAAAQPKRVPIWEQESLTPPRLNAPARIVKAKHMAADRNGPPVLVEKRTKKALASRKISNPIQQVQGIQELRLPIANLRDADLAPTGIPQVTPQTAQGFDAPAPNDVFGVSNRKEVEPPITRKFVDQTPAQSLRGQANTQTKEVQAPSRFEFDSLPELNNDTPPAAADAFENPFEPPNSDPPAVNANSTPETFELPAPQAEPGNIFADPDANAADSLSPQPPTEEESDEEDMKEELKRQLNELEKLPELDGADSSEPSDLFGDDDKGNNPLYSEDDSKDEQVTRELAFTNGRDCVAEAAACRTDFEYLKRRERTDMSLNITPSLTPTEVDMATAEQTRIEKLAKAPTRTWRDRSGNVIAEGNLDDYRNDKVIVRTVNGTLRTIPHHTLANEDRCFVAAWWELPAECNFEGERFEMRDFRLTTFTWTAAGTCHKPLYYEQVGVERYGHSSGPIVQPLVSGVHFFGDILMAPYHAGINPPNECQYTLGYYRPGDCAPWLVPGFPFTERGFKWEGLAIGAAIALMP